LIRFYKGEWRGERLPVNDSEEVITFFNDVWKCDNTSQVAHKVLSKKSLWGEDLTKVDGMAEGVKEWLEQLK
jgi:tagaturonate reductase